MANSRPPPAPPGGCEPCPRCRLEHEPVDLAQWLWLVRDTKPKPPGGQQAALVWLASRMNRRTGCGWASNDVIAKDAEVSQDVVERATKWARSHLLLHRAKKGGRNWSGDAPVSLWHLLDPRLTPADPGDDVETRDDAGLNGDRQTRADAGLGGLETRDDAGMSDPQTRADAGLSGPYKPAKSPPTNPQNHPVQTRASAGKEARPVKAKPEKLNQKDTVDGVTAADVAAEGEESPTGKEDHVTRSRAENPTLFPDLPEDKDHQRPEQIAGQLADQFVAAVPLAGRPGTFQMIKRALTAKDADKNLLYTTERVRAAVIAVAEAKEHLTRYTLYDALEGRPVGRRPNGRPNGRGANGVRYQGPADQGDYDLDFQS